MRKATLGQKIDKPKYMERNQTLNEIKKKISLIKAESELLKQKESFYETMVDCAITFEDRGDLKLANAIKTSIINFVLNETRPEANTKSKKIRKRIIKSRRIVFFLKS